METKLLGISTIGGDFDVDLDDDDDDRSDRILDEVNSFDDADNFDFEYDFDDGNDLGGNDDDYF